MKVVPSRHSVLMYVKIIKINVRDDIYIARGLMILQNPQTNDNDKARGDKQRVT